MTAWGWVGLALTVWLVNGVAFWRLGVKHARERRALETQVRSLTAARELDALKGEARSRAAATATRAQIADSLSLLEPLKCGRGPGHYRASDVRRIVAGEPHA